MAGWQRAGRGLTTGGNVVSGAACDLIDADMVDLWHASERFGAGRHPKTLQIGNLPHQRAETLTL